MRVLGFNPKDNYLEVSLPPSGPRFPHQDWGRLDRMGLEGLFPRLGFILETSVAGSGD